MDLIQFLTGKFRRFRSAILRREVEIVGQCRLCGRCCQDILLRDKGRWIRRRKQYDALCEDEPVHARFKITGRGEDGCLAFTCSCLGSDNLCTDYETRPALCRNYPAKSLYYQGGWIRSDCGFSFKAVTFRDVFRQRTNPGRARFADVLDREIEQTKKTS